MTIHNKIILVVIGALIMGAFLSFRVAYEANKESINIETTVNKAFTAHELSEKIEGQFNDANSLVYRVTDMTDFISMHDIKSEFDKTALSLGTTIKHLEDHALTPEMFNIIFEFEKLYENWIADISVILGLKAAHSIPTIEKIKRHQDKISSIIIRARTQLSKDAHTIIENAKVSMTDTLIFASAITLFLTMFGIAIASRLANDLTKPLIELVKSAEQLNAGDTRAYFSGTNRTDEIGAVSRSIASFRDGVIERLNLNKLQSQFITMASHEFRTPLAIIDSTAQRMKRRAAAGKLTSDDLDQRIDKIRSAVDRMTRLMESTLSAARLEDGQLKINPGKCNIKSIIQNTCNSQNELATSHTITCDIDTLPETIMADTGAMEQIFTNLLSNAVKYSPENSLIELFGYCEKSEIVISVRDYGIGIDAGELNHIGERFFRASTSTGIEGTGIGLNIVNNFINEHDGTIKIESVVGEGTIFIIRLPVNGPVVSNLVKTKAA